MASDPTSTPRPLRLLIADDDGVTRILLREVLAKEGYHVIEASDGQQAAHRVVEDCPDLVILDVEMPVMTGWDVLQHIKGHPALRHLPVLMLTTLGSSEDEIRGLELDADDYMLKPVHVPRLLARVRSALKRSAIRLEANPLTHLPGNNLVEREILSRIQSGRSFAVVYSDLNNFKAFNDRYGFLRGDQLLRATGELLLDAAQQGDFVGHIGGDDFITVSTPERAEGYCRQVIGAFDAMVLRYYDPDDRVRGGIEISTRRGQLIFFSTMGIAMGGVTNVHRPLSSVGQVSSLCAEMKRYAKGFGKSIYAFDRRTD